MLPFRTVSWPNRERKTSSSSFRWTKCEFLFLKVLTEKHKDEELSQLIDLGTCGLQTTHNAFKHGEKASDWQLKKLMSSMSKIFHETLGGCADYKTVTDAMEKDYPMQFVTHRWVENDVVAKKARVIWSKIIEVVSYWQQLLKNKQPGLGKPGANTSYDNLCKAVKNCLVPVKLLFFEELAKKFNEFLVVFQTDKSMAPFLMETLEDLIKTLMRKFIRKDRRAVYLQIISESTLRLVRNCLIKFCLSWLPTRLLLLILPTTLLHGQAQVEHGFSVNKNLLVESQHNNFNCSTYHPRSHGVS